MIFGRVYDDQVRINRNKEIDLFFLKGNYPVIRPSGMVILTELLNTTTMIAHAGKPYDFTIADHNGPRFAMSADVNIFGVLSVGAGFTVAPVLGWDGGVYIISRSTAVGIGIEGSPVSGNVNYGNTKLDR